MKRIFIILGSIGVIAGLFMYFYGIALNAEYHEYRSTLPPCKYDREVSCIPPAQYFHHMMMYGIPVSLVSVTVITFGFIKSKYYYVYMPVTAILLVVSFFGVIFSLGS